MVNKLPLARKEIERWTVLLAREPDSTTEPVANGRDERKESPSTFRGNPHSSVKDTPRQSKSSRKAKRTDASSSRPEGHGRIHKDRKSDRRDEGEDNAVWRSARELGVELPSSFCPDGKPHHWIGADTICSGVMFRCKHCKRNLWLPMHFNDAVRAGRLIEKFGSEGYCRYLDYPANRPARLLIAKLQELERLGAVVTDPMEMARIAVKILDQKDYGRR